MFITLLVVTTFASLATAATIGRWLRHRRLVVGTVTGVCSRRTAGTITSTRALPAAATRALG
jgi:hypothetical protein